MNMFARKPKPVTSQAAVDEINRKKLVSKILDVKKEVNSRLRYLKNYIESTDNQLELKLFFDQNYSQIYFIFYESFVLVETNLKQKVNKINREELDLVLFIFQKILILQPEKINQRWQSRSIGRLLQKLLHISNTKLIKIIGLRLFLLWYQILNKNRTQIEELMFQKLIQGFDLFHSNVHTTIGLENLNAEAQKVFSNHQTNNQLSATAMLFSTNANLKSTIYQYEITYLIPHSSQNEHIFMIQQPGRDQQSTQTGSNLQTPNSTQSSQQIQSQAQSNISQQSVLNSSSLTPQALNQQKQSNIYVLTAELLKYMLNFMQNDFLIVEWSSDRYKQSILCYEFLFDEFKRFYLSYMFPNAFLKHNSSTNLNNLTSNNSSNLASLNVYSNLDLLNLVNNEIAQQNQSSSIKQQHHETRHQQYATYQLNYQQLDEKKQVQLNCKEEIIKWLIDVLLIDSSTSVGSQSIQSGLGNSLLTMTAQMDSSVYSSITSSELKSLDDFSCDESIDSNYSSITNSTITNTTQVNVNQTNKQLIQKVILSTQSNVNLVHEILRNSFFLNFDENSQTVKLVLDAYKKWFLNETKLPSFMLEPVKHEINKNDFLTSTDFQESLHEQENTHPPIFNLNQSGEKLEAESELDTDIQQRTPSVSSSSSILSLKTNQTEQIQQYTTRIGTTKCLQIFYYHSSNLLLNRSYLQRSDKIKNICCYLLDIYKTFIKRIQMDSYSWTLLIKILLRVCHFLFNSNSDYLSLNTNASLTSTNISNTNLGDNSNSTSSTISQLIKLTTETTLMAMIKATYNFNLSNDLWDQLVNLFQIVNSNHDVVDKWMESIDDLIRQIFKYIYNIDLSLYKGSANLSQEDDESDSISNANSNLLTNNRSNSVSSSQMDERRKLKHKNREKQHLQIDQSQISSSSSSNYLLSNTVQVERKSMKSNNNVTYSPTVLGSVGLNKQSLAQMNQATQNPNQITFTRQANSLMSYSNDIEQSKSPSLTDENFLNLTNQQAKKSNSTLLQEQDQHLNSEETNDKTNEFSTDTENDSSILNDQVHRTGEENDEEEEIDDDSYDYNQYNSKYFNRNQKRRTDDDSYNGEDDDCASSSINETDSNDSTSYDKSATLKAANQIDQLNSYNSNTIKSNTLTNINKFSASEKSIYYSSELLADKPNTSGSSSINSITSPTLQIKLAHNTNNTTEDDSSSMDDSNNQDISKSNNNSFTIASSNTHNTSNTQTTNLSCSSSSSSSSNNFINQNSLLINNNSSSPSLKQYSPKLANNSPNQVNISNSSVPPPLPPLPANLPSKFYLLNQAQLSKANQLDQIDQVKTRKSIENESQSDSNLIQISTSSNSSSVQASPLGKLSISMNQNQPAQQQVQPLVEFNLSSPNQSQKIKLKDKLENSSGKPLNKNEERSASFIMDTPKLLNNKPQDPQSIRSNQSLLAISTNSKTNRQSLSIVTNNLDLPQAPVVQEIELDLNKKFKSTSLMLLRRLFGCMGNVNFIKDPLIHKKIFEFILNKWTKLSRIKDEMLVFMSSSTNICELIMPQSYFATWLFESIHKYLHELSSSIPPSLSSNYQSATLIAYKILCNTVIKSANSPPDDLFYSISSNFLDLFYITLHNGLISNDKNILNCIIQSCSTKFWHLMLESSSLLIKDFVNACTQIDNQGPKLDAISILGSFVCLPDYFGESITFLTQHQNLKSSSTSPSITASTTTLSQDQSLNTVQFSRDEFKNLLVNAFTNFELLIGPDLDNVNTMSNFNNSKCVLLCSLTCFIFDEILSHSNSKTWNLTRLTEACKKIFKDLEYKDQYSPILIKMSCDCLRFLACLSNFIFQKDIQFAINIINELNSCLVKLINNKPSSASINENYEKAIISNMFALLEWCMNMPLEQLKDQDRATLLKNNFKLIIHISNTFKQGESLESEHIHLAAKFIISHLLNHLNHYPYGTYGPTKICSSCNETNDFTMIQPTETKPNDSNNNNNNNNPNDDLSVILFDQPNIQFFTVNNQFLLSFVELPLHQNTSEIYMNDLLKQKLKLSGTVCRFIVRDFSGKYCWDCCLLNSPNNLFPKIINLEKPSEITKTINGETNSVLQDDNNISFDFKNLTNLNNEQINKNIDLLEHMLEYVNYSSPECRLDTLISSQSALSPSLTHLNSSNTQTKEQSIFNNLDELKQKIMSTKELTEPNETSDKISNSISEKKPDPVLTSSPSANSNDQQLNYYFNLCKSFVHQMGLLSWEKRQTFNLLHKSPQLLRELKSLDDQACRETHKIALIYIAKGQEDKQSILSNEKGSKDYHDFLSALAWPINLETHEGFMGGLQHVSNQLKTAPYYSNSLCEVLFHVSTMMNNPNDQNKISKWRHLGNDSVQIIWSEHTKDYDRSILATEFADVIICIYPMSNGLYRIQIIKKHSVGFFGPLFDGAILHKKIMPHLIRATAINASRVLLSSTKGFQDFYVHRSHAINNVVSKLTEKQTFEQFLVDVYLPNIKNGSSSKSKTDQQTPNVHSPVLNSSNILTSVVSSNFDNDKQLVL